MPMRKAFTISVIAHVGVALLVLIGIPLGETPPVEDVQTMEVDIADLTVTTKKQKPPPEVKQEPKKDQPPAPPPPPAAPRPPAPPPAPEPTPKDQPKAEAPPVPAPSPDAAAKPEPAPPPPPKPKEDKVALASPIAKPRPKDVSADSAFDNMLNTLKLDDSKPADTPDTPKKKKDFFDTLNLDNIDPKDKPKPREKSQIAAILGTRLTVSEKDALRRQIEKCWNVPIGARNPEELVVQVRIRVNRDRTVQDATIVNSARVASDSFFRAMAESARRAIMNPKCSPLKLPPDKYDQWSEITMTFDPSKMVGR